MQADVYKKLARHLDETPNGFPPTASGVELRLLAKIFTPDEAYLATFMSLHSEPYADIAERAGLETSAARQILKGMAAKGLVRFRRREKQLVFALEPFIVGFYEAQLPRMDREMAELFEQYYQESQGGITHDQPSLHRVIPVQESIPHEISIFPYEQASQILASAKAWGVRDCICRVQQKLVGKGCNRPLEVCLTLAPVEGAFGNSPVDRPITLEEAHRILRQSEETNLIHSTGNFIDGVTYICNCCTCCCGIMRSMTEFKIPTSLARSDFYAVVNEDLCMDCGDCVVRCQFGAISLDNRLAVIDTLRCVGCGQCTTVCVVDALHLERHPENETIVPPQSIREWGALRLANQGKLP